MGPNGAGKTTTYMIVIDQPDSGRILLNQEISSPSTKEHVMALVTYPKSIFTQLSVADNLMAVLEAIDLNTKQRHLELEALLKEFKQRTSKEA